MRETFNNRLFRKNYGKIKEILDIPNLIEIQLDSYENFFRTDIPLRSGITLDCRQFSTVSFQ